MNRFHISFLLFFIFTRVFSQDPLRFSNEIEAIKLKNRDLKVERPIVFAGSSTFRLWTSMQADLKNPEIINNGFGGSQYSDLVYYIDALVLNLNPSKLYIYEGDNDLADGEAPDRVLEEAKLLISTIKKLIPDIQIYVFSAKPSPARWDRKPAYSNLNMFMREYCDETDGVEYIDVWRAMLTPDGMPNPDLFLEDQLHMNEKGYQIWIQKILPTLK